MIPIPSSIMIPIIVGLVGALLTGVAGGTALYWRGEYYSAIDDKREMELQWASAVAQSQEKARKEAQREAQAQVQASEQRAQYAEHRATQMTQLATIIGQSNENACVGDAIVGAIRVLYENPNPAPNRSPTVLNR
ncbi:MAG: hypothetical protein MJH10_09335 [Epibacterium sp.]|nr:hypothetical protein [Epibacterium sp.]NQX73738.1 hypothetical protein [Epibacterium sp.]